MKYKLVKVSHIKQQHLWKGLWNTWKIPLMTLYKLALLWIITTVIQNWPTTFVEVSYTHFQQNPWAGVQNVQRSPFMRFWRPALLYINMA